MYLYTSTRVTRTCTVRAFFHRPEIGRTGFEKNVRRLRVKIFISGKHVVDIEFLRHFDGESRRGPGLEAKVRRPQQQHAVDLRVRD